MSRQWTVDSRQRAKSEGADAGAIGEQNKMLRMTALTTIYYLLSTAC